MAYNMVTFLEMNKYSNLSNWWQSLPTAYNSVCGSAKFRVNPEDFIVDEELSFTPDGEGENVFLRIEKKGLNTEQVAKSIARFATVKLMDVGYAGLKDKNAITRQWFSVRIPGKVEHNWEELNSDNMMVIEITRNRKKLRRGVIKLNSFEITVRDYSGNLDQLDSVCKKIKAGGVPNYFGDQRFGHDAGNIDKAYQISTGEYKPKGKGERGIILSAARSYIFNQILSKRVDADSWNKLIDGDIAIFDDSNSFFAVENIDQGLQHKVQEMDVHPAAALFGSGELKTMGLAQQVEEQVISDNNELALLCKNNNMRMDRRAMRLKVHDFECEQLSDNEIRFTFKLKTGAYATSVLREVLELTTDKI